MEITEIPSKVYTVSELNIEVQGYLKQRYPTTIWVCGEIKNYNRNAHRDHIFFELCEKDSHSDKLLARITAVIFDSVKGRIADSLARVDAGFQLQDDIEVKFECMVDLYPPSGSYQLKIVGIDPVFTLGKIAQQRYAILETLKQEGLLDKNKELTIPLVPLRIGLITSYNSAAYHDFLKELADSHYAFEVFHWDARMQGHLVEEDVCSGIRFFNESGVDLVVVIRGGGSRSDMAWFDSLKIGRTVAHSGIAVLTGLGHEIDLSVTDLVAHTYKKTPTAVAQYLVGLVRAYLERLDQLGNEIVQDGVSSIEGGKQRLSDIQNEMVRWSQQRIQNGRRALQEAAWQIQQLHNRLIRQTLLVLKSATERIRLKSILWLKDCSKRIEQLRQLLPKVSVERVNRATKQMEMLEIRRSAVDPIQVLRRGFTLSLDSRGKPIRRLSNVRSGDVLTTIIIDGQVRSRVTEKRRSEDGASPLEVERTLL